MRVRHDHPHWLLVPALILLLAPRSAPAQEPAASGELSIRSLLVLEGGGPRSRRPVVIDPVESMLVRGTWKAPAEGAEVRMPSGDARKWQRVAADAQSEFELRGGWGFAVVEVAERQILLLEAHGHAYVTVNGEPRVGDLYGQGITRLPILLEEGRNELLFKSGRGKFGARLVPPPAAIFIEARDATVPDAVHGETGMLDAGLLITNATESWQRDLEVVAAGGSGGSCRTTVSPLPPLSFRKVAVELPRPGPDEDGETGFSVRILGSDEAAAQPTEIKIRMRKASEAHRRTFRSTIDGSVQSYAVTPASEDEEHPEPKALILSLHGAGVDAMNQAACYTPKPWCVVIAPTNRRPYGFDWEDWGRLDALEVLGIAQEAFATDPRRTCLTGHSMGGHGTWSLGAHLPGRFAAIAPSAGWTDFWSYGGAPEPTNPTPVEALLARAANGSRTLLLERNYLHCGIYILHGDQDDNVPVEQARSMRRRLAEFHPNWAYYERAGAGHWWGNACVDWPPLFDFLRQSVLPETKDVRRVAFATVSPGISAACRWVSIEAQTRSMAVSSVDLAVDPEKRAISGATENVARLAFDVRTILPPGQPVTVRLDDQAIESIPWPAEENPVRLARSADGRWRLETEVPPLARSAQRSGPFKDAFRNRMIFVCGTKGTPEENAWAFAKARYDAEVFWYRGNGSVDILSDAEFEGSEWEDRNVILYGNADTNASWDSVLDQPPIEVRRDAVRVGARRIEGDDLAGLFVWPRKHSPTSCVGVVAGTGLTGCRVTNQLPYFVSGVGYPDWIVIGAEMLESGAAGIRGAGFFGPEWSLDRGEAIWRQ